MNKWILVLLLFGNTDLTGQVNLQTGAAEAIYPLFDYTDTKSRLHTDVILTYVSGNGLKVNELATSVGTGWALRVGGSITRIQNGEPDDQVGDAFDPSFVDAIAYGSHPDWDYPNGYLYTTKSPLNAVPGQIMHAPQFPMNFYTGYRQNFDDREQDVFVFQFNGRIGKFVIGKNKVPKVLNDGRLVVSFTETNMEAEDIRTRISSFVITDEDGIQYKFSEREVIEALKYNSGILVNNLRVLKGTENPSGRKRRIVSRWFLKEIVNPVTNEKIVFNYNDFAVDVEGTKHITKQTVVASGTTKVSQETLMERMKMTSKRLSSIVFPDPYKIDLVYSTADRVDYPGEKSLNEIRVSYNNGLLYGYQFNYGYFFKNQVVPTSYAFQTADKRFARLCLNNFKKMGANGSFLPAHEFSYNMPTGPSSDIIPPMFSLYADHWGYYNQYPDFINEDANGFPSGSLTAKSFATYSLLEARYGILKSVKYPEGGVLEWQYEGNKAENSPFPDKYAGGVRVSRTVLYDGNDHANDMIKGYKYLTETGTSSAWGFEVPQYTSTKGLRQYKLSGVHNQGNCFKDLFSSFVTKMLYNAPQAMAAQSVGGNALGAFASEAAFEVMVAFMIAQIIDIVFSPAYRDYTISIVKSDNYNGANPLPYQYARVEVVDEIWTNQVLTGTNGKVVHEFTSDQDFPLLDGATFSAPYSSGKPRFAEWQYGLPKAVTWFNAAGQPVKKITNQYNPVVRQITANSNYASRTSYVNRVVSGSWEMFSVAFEPEFIDAVVYYPVEGRMELTKSTEHVFNSAGGSTFFEVNYTYSDSNFLPRTVYRKDSKGNYVGTTTYYVADYNNVLPIMSAMKGTNMMNAPVSVNSWKKSSTDATRQLTGAMVTEFAQLSNYDIRPFQVYKSELSVPLGNTIAEPNDANFDKTNYKNYPYLKPYEATIYANGNPIQYVLSNGNSSSARLYDHSNRLLVAKVENAMNLEVKYSSFEGENTGGWIYSLNNVITDFSVTGRKHFNLAQGPITTPSTDVINKSVVITLWATQSAPSINASGTPYNPAKVGPTVNGWTYYEYELPAINGIVSISGNGRLDELRLYPKTARMTTYTHDPGIGTTSECDVNNKISYFEYDTFGRVKTIKDQYRNLIKAYEYNYKQ